MSDQIKIKPEHKSLADRIEPLLKVNTKGEFEDTEEAFKVIATADGRDVDQMKSDDAYRADYFVGKYLAAGRVARSFLEKTKEVNTVTGNFEIGRNRLEVSFDRHQRVPNRVMDKETGNFKVDGEKDLYGGGQLKFKVYGTKNSSGDLKNARAFVEQEFAVAFSAFSK